MFSFQKLKKKMNFQNKWWEGEIGLSFYEEMFGKRQEGFITF